MLLRTCSVKLGSIKKRDGYNFLFKHFTVPCKCKSRRKALNAPERRMKLTARIRNGRKAVSVLSTVRINCAPLLPRHMFYQFKPHACRKEGWVRSLQEPWDRPAETTTTPNNRAVPGCWSGHSPPTAPDKGIELGPWSIQKVFLAGEHQAQGCQSCQFKV